MTGASRPLGTAELGAVLLDAVRPGPVAASTARHLEETLAADCGGLTELAVRHRVQALLQQRIVSLGIASSRGDALHSSYLGSVVRHMRLTQELHRLAPLLDGLDVPWLSFKGPVLSEAIYERPDQRSYGDLDVLVAARDLERVLDALHEGGAHLFSENWHVLARTERAQLSVVTHHGLPLDLHWNLFNNPGVRRAFPVPSAELLQRRAQVQVGGRTVWGLNPADTLVHLAAHGALSGADLLVWTVDLHMAAARVKDWEDVVRTARRYGLHLVCAVMLQRCQHLLATPLPTGLLDELSGARVWRAIISELDRRRPPNRYRLGTGRLMLTSTRSGTASSTGELLREAWAQALVPFLRESDHPWRVALRRGRPGPTAHHEPVAVRSLAHSPERTDFLAYALSSPT